MHLDGFAMPGTECDWFGMDCDTSGDNVKWVNLSINILSGNITPEIGNLTNLEKLRLDAKQ